jgi:hypothetical protein
MTRRSASVARAGVLTALVLGLAACGAASPGVGSGPPGSSTTTSGATIGRAGGTNPTGNLRSKLLQLATCMRAHGVPTFPDPIAPGSPPTGTSSYLGDGPDPETSPRYQAAFAACRKYVVASPVAPGTAPDVKAEQLEYARCMRAHGVVAFPDPGADGGFTIPRSIDRDSPTFLRATAACEGLLSGPPGLG